MASDGRAAWYEPGGMSGWIDPQTNLPYSDAPLTPGDFVMGNGSIATASPGFANLPNGEQRWALTEADRAGAAYRQSIGQPAYNDAAYTSTMAGLQPNPASPSAPPLQATYIDPTTGRRAMSGPQGEAGYQNQDTPDMVEWNMPNGLHVWYRPGVDIQNGNRAAIGLHPLGEATSVAPGANPDIVRNLFTQSQQPAAGKGSTPGFDPKSAGTRALLDQYDLGQLAPIVDSWIRNGMSEDEVMLQLRDINTDAGKIFDNRFKAIRMRKDAGLAPISPAQYVQYEQDARNALRTAGLPQGFWDSRDDFTTLLVNDVTVPELTQRVQRGFAEVANAPAEVRSAFSTFFGANGDAALASYFLDPKKAQPLLEEAVNTAKVGGAGLQFGLDLNETRANQIAKLGVDFNTARNAFSNVRSLDQIFNESFSETQDLTAQGTGVNAAFNLDQGASQLAIQQRMDQRRAKAAGGGGPSVSGRGAVGLGSANIS